MKLAVIDLETSGLNVSGDPRKGIPDCILEIGLVVLNAETLVEECAQSWGVMPPSATDTETFDGWEMNLREKNRFVFDMHSKTESDEPSLLAALREHAGSKGFEHGAVEQSVLRTLRAHVPEGEKAIFTGNSIANLDIPMLRMWMPELHAALHYRIMDVSVLRTFYMELARVKLPDGLAEAIKSGGGGHRALADALHCAESLRKLVAYARDVQDEAVALAKVCG